MRGDEVEPFIRPRLSQNPEGAESARPPNGFVKYAASPLDDRFALSTRTATIPARIAPHRLGSLKQLVVATARFEALSEAVVDGQDSGLSAHAHAW